MTTSVKIRELAVDAYESGAGTYEEVAGLFGAGSASLKRWVRQKRTTGSVEPLPRGGGTKPLIDERGEKFIREALQKQPDLGLEELRDLYNRRRRRGRVSVSTIGRCVRERLKLPRKKRLTAQSNKTPRGFVLRGQTMRSRSLS